MRETMSEERKRILWADDEIDHLRPHMKFLEDRGFQVEPVTNGEDAIAVVEESGGRIDLVILDEMMPGISGTATAMASSKSLLPAVKAIVVLFS